MAVVVRDAEAEEVMKQIEALRASLFGTPAFETEQVEILLPLPLMQLEH